MNLKIDYSGAITILRTEIKKIIIVSIISFVIALGYCLFWPKTYSSSAVINPPKLSDAGSGLSPAVGAMMALAGGQQATRSNMDITLGILQSHQLGVLVQKYLESDPKYTKQKELPRYSVEYVPDLKSGFLSIVVSSSRPDISVDIANYYVMGLGKQISNIAIAKALQKASFYTQQIEIAKANRDQAESQLLQFRMKYGMTAGVQSDLSTTIVSTLQAQMVAQQAVVDSLKSYLTEDNPDYIAAMAQLNGIKNQIRLINNSAAASINPKNVAKGSNGDVATESYFIPLHSAEYERVWNEYNLRSLIYMILIKQYEANNLDVQSELLPVSIDLVDPPFISSKPSSPKVMKVLGLDLILTFVLVCVVILLRNFKKFVTYV